MDNKSNRAKEKTIRESKRKVVFCVIFAVLAVLFLVQKDTTPTHYVLFIGFLALAFVFFCAFLRRKKLISKYSYYERIISPGEPITIFEISQITQKTEKTVIKDIRFLIDNGLFQNVYIDHRHCCLMPVQPSQEETKEINQKCVDIICEHCGKMNRVGEGKQTKCISCGSLIEHKIIPIERKKKRPGWALIIVMLILFFPVGLILLILRLASKSR
jgi:Ca2+/Na+ antiporter